MLTSQERGGEKVSPPVDPVAASDLVVSLDSNEFSPLTSACPLSLGSKSFQSVGLLSAELSITSPRGLASEHGEAP